MPANEAPCVELGSVPDASSVGVSPSPSEISSASSPEPQNVRATPLFRALAMPPPDPDQPPGQDELERRLPGYRRIIIPRELTLIELLKQACSVTTDEEVLHIREVKLRVVAERVGLRRLHVLTPSLRSLTLDGSAISSLRDLGIGLVHLKILSVNRCGLTSMDGIWGLGSLRELYAAGNHFHDLQPLAGLHKLHTLNLADNPISESSRLWTLGICSSLRYLTLRGTPASESAEYRSRIALVLPMLVYLDDRPLHNDIEYDLPEGVFGAPSLSSDSDLSDGEGRECSNADTSLKAFKNSAVIESIPGPSNQYLTEDNGGNQQNTADTISYRKRPATTENAGLRPSKPDIPTRPRSAQDRKLVAPSRLHFMNTLLDDEWRCNGSQLTSHEAVCGNLARALRRPTSSQSKTSDALKEMIQETMTDASRAIAAEIPRVPCLEDWDKFRKETGIDINIDFNERPKGDPSIAIERLERIEKETVERLKYEAAKAKEDSTQSTSTTIPLSAIARFPTYDQNDFWGDVETFSAVDTRIEVDELFEEMNAIYNGRHMLESSDSVEEIQAP